MSIAIHLVVYFPSGSNAVRSERRTWRQRHIVPPRLYLRLADEVEEHVRRHWRGFEYFGEKV
jgi:hypothetical protein